MIATLMFASILIPLMLGVPIAVSLGGAGLLWLYLKGPAFFNGAGHAIWNTADSYLLTAIPLFILMGEFIQRSGVAERFYQTMAQLTGNFRAGLLQSNILACAVFSAVSGSSVATAATIGRTAIPSLLALGYPRSLVFGSLAAGGTIGILIPPSIPLIIYASLTDVSLGRLFLAAFVPGIVITLIFCIYLMIFARRTPAFEVDLPDIVRLPLSKSVLNIAPIISILTIVIGGIYTGWATPTEVAAVGVIAAVISAMAIGQINWKIISSSVIAAVSFTAMIVFVVIGAQIFSYALLTWGVPREIASSVSAYAEQRYLVLLAIIVMYLVLGMFIDAISMMVLTISIVFPVILNLGFDPIWFGIVLVLLLEIGLLTPPVGINLYTIQGVAPDGTKLGEVTRGAIPFILLLLIGIVLLVAVPGIATWLPSQMF